MSNVDIDAYCPTEEEEYMSEMQLQYFKSQLHIWRSELIMATDSFVRALKETSLRKPDLVDQSSTQADMALDFKAGSRQRRLIQEIDYALERIEDGEYGYCEISGEEIGLKRLMARPIATKCIEVQERLERMAVGPAKCVVACRV